MYNVKTNDSSLNCQDKMLIISTLDIVRLMTKIFANEKMKRFIKKGIQRLEKDLDMLELFKQHKIHQKYLKEQDKDIVKDHLINID